MALPCALGSELIRYFATGGGKKNVFKALFPWGKASLVRNVRAEMSSDPAAGSCLPGGPAASTPHVPVPPRPRLCGVEGASPGADFGKLWPLPSPHRLHHPLLPPHLPLPFSRRRAPRPASNGVFGGLGAGRCLGGAGGGRGWRLHPALPPGRQRAAAAVEKDAATLSPVSTSHSFHWRVKISNFFF